MSTPAPTLVVALGFINATLLYVDIGQGLGSAVPVSVTLTQSYTVLHPPNFPTRPGFMGSHIADVQQTLAPGTVFKTFAVEAAALVAANAATQP